MLSIWSTRAPNGRMPPMENVNSLSFGNAANLIAAQVTSPGPGFFLYFNSGLDLPRSVFSTDLNDETADLKVLARLTNLTGQPGRDLIPTFTSANCQIAAVPLPEPATLLLLTTAAPSVSVATASGARADGDASRLPRSKSGAFGAGVR